LLWHAYYGGLIYQIAPRIIDVFLVNDLVSALCLIIHGYITVLHSAHVSRCGRCHAKHVRRALKLRESYLIHLIVNMTVARRLEYLMPLFCHGVELVHVIRTTVRIGTCKQIEQSTMLYNSMACPRRVNYIVIIQLFLISCIH
jgi:hypothetical protein